MLKYVLKIVKILVHKDLVFFPSGSTSSQSFCSMAARVGSLLTLQQFMARSVGKFGEVPEVNILRIQHPSNRPWHKAPSTPPKEALGSAPAVLPWRNTDGDFGNDWQSVECSKKVHEDVKRKEIVILVFKNVKKKVKGWQHQLKRIQLVEAIGRLWQVDAYLPYYCLFYPIAVVTTLPATTPNSHRKSRQWIVPHLSRCPGV